MTILCTDAVPSGYDWVYEWVKPSSEVNKKIQSRFIWTVTPVNKEHAIVAYTQGEQDNTVNAPCHTIRSKIFSHGMGAYVMQGEGLGLEMWGPAGNALWWTQVNPTMGGVTLPVITLAQALSNPPNAYITSGPTSFSANTAYWVRVDLTNQTNGYTDIVAELFVNTTLVQKAKISVITSSWTNGSSNMNGTVARAFGSNTIQSDAFSYF